MDLRHVHGPKIPKQRNKHLKCFLSWSKNGTNYLGNKMPKSVTVWPMDSGAVPVVWPKKTKQAISKPNKSHKILRVGTEVQQKKRSATAGSLPVKSEASAWALDSGVVPVMWPEGKKHERVTQDRPTKQKVRSHFTERKDHPHMYMTYVEDSQLYPVKKNYSVNEDPRNASMQDSPKRNQELVESKATVWPMDSGSVPIMWPKKGATSKLNGKYHPLLQARDANSQATSLLKSRQNHYSGGSIFWPMDSGATQATWPKGKKISKAPRLAVGNRNLATAKTNQQDSGVIPQTPHNLHSQPHIYVDYSQNVSLNAAASQFSENVELTKDDFSYLPQKSQPSRAEIQHIDESSRNSAPVSTPALYQDHIEDVSLRTGTSEPSLPGTSRNASFKKASNTNINKTTSGMSGALPVSSGNDQRSYAGQGQSKTLETATRKRSNTHSYKASSTGIPFMSKNTSEPRIYIDYAKDVSLFPIDKQQSSVTMKEPVPPPMNAGLEKQQTLGAYQNIEPSYKGASKKPPLQSSGAYKRPSSDRDVTTVWMMDSGVVPVQWPAPQQRTKGIPVMYGPIRHTGQDINTNTPENAFPERMHDIGPVKRKGTKRRKQPTQKGPRFKNN